MPATRYLKPWASPPQYKIYRTGGHIVRLFRLPKGQCHPEGGEAESRDLGTELTMQMNEMRRSFDSLSFAQDDNLKVQFNFLLH